MLRKLTTVWILVLTTSFAIVSSASAMFREPPPFPGSAAISTRLASNANIPGFTALGSPTVFIATRYAGDPAALRAVPAALGGGGSYATQPAAGSNVKVPGLQP
jgi:hypothetical protein